MTERPLRIAMVAACGYPTTQGSQVYIRGQSEALGRLGHEVHIVTYHFGEDLPTPHMAGLHRIPRIPGYQKLRAGPSWFKPLADALLTRRLLQVVRDHDIDLIHTHNYEAPLAGYLVRAVTGTPVIYNNHNLMSEELEGYFEGRWSRALARRLALQLDARVPRAADGVVAISRSVVPALEQLGVEPGLIHQVPPGVALADLDGPAAPELLAPFSLPKAPRLIYTGNPDGYQGLPVLIRALPRVRARCPQARLLMASGSSLSACRALARELGVEDALETLEGVPWPVVRELLRVSQVAVLSRPVCSGFPIKLLNYMAAGLPTVCTRGSAEALTDGLDGLVVENGDHEAFADACVALLSDPDRARGMGAAARRSVEERYSWARRGRELVAAYRAILGRT